MPKRAREVAEHPYTTMTVRRETREAVFEFSEKGESLNDAIMRALKTARRAEA